jgi:hypothetical protein
LISVGDRKLQHTQEKIDEIQSNGRQTGALSYYIAEHGYFEQTLDMLHEKMAQHVAGVTPEEALSALYAELKSLDMPYDSDDHDGLSEAMERARRVLGAEA